MLTTTYQLVSTGIKKFKTTDIPTDSNKYDNDYLFEQLSDLVNPEYKKWYMKRFYTLGKEEVLRLASQAKSDGNNPQKLFSYLLKK